MRFFKYFLLLALFWLNQWVIAAEPVFGTDAETNHALNIAPPPGKALVYIYLRARDGSGMTPTILLNNHEIGRLVPGAFTVWQLAPGQLNIRVEGEQATSLSVISQAGKVYLFRIAMLETATGPQAQLTSLPATYRSDMIGTQLLKNSRQITALATAPVTPSSPTAKAASEPQLQEKPGQTETVDKPISQPRPTYLTPGGMGLMLKSGALTLATERQTIVSNNYVFDDSASGVYDIDVYYQFNSGMAVGGELIGYSVKNTRVGFPGTNTVDVLILMGTIKQFFRTEARLQPFLGAGIGVASADISGPTLSGDSSGVAYQGQVGIEYRTENIGVVVEYRIIGADTEDSASNQVDVSASGIFAGLAFHF